VGALLLSVAGLCVVFFLLRVPNWTKALRDAAAPADRIVVEPLEGWLTPQPKSIEIRGSAQAEIWWPNPYGVA